MPKLQSPRQTKPQVALRLRASQLQLQLQSLKLSELQRWALRLPQPPQPRATPRPSRPRVKLTLQPPTPREVHFRVDADGKVHYAGRDDAADRRVARGSYMRMPIHEFARWKNAGKRTPSNKVTDPASGKSYFYENNVFHEFAGMSRSAPVDAKTQRDLDARFHELIDRRRPDRTRGPLAWFDVSPYESPVSLSGRYHRPLPKARKALPAVNDHLPSGQALRLSDPGAAAMAYAQGIAIAIPTPFHVDVSPSLAGRQRIRDIEWDGKNPPVRKERKLFDAERRARAFHRDMEFMLANAAWSDRLKQLGGYRTEYRMNTRMHGAFAGGRRGVDPKESAMSFTPVDPRDPGKPFLYRPHPAGGTQGERIADDIRRRLIKEGFAKNVDRGKKR